MKRLLTLAIAMALVAALSLGAFALEVPTSSVVQNLNGVQQYIKTYTVSPKTDPATLIEEPFDYEGYTYTYSDITKQENRRSEEKAWTESITVITEKKDLETVLEALAPTLEFDDGRFSGTLRLDHTTIRTEAAGYDTYSYTISATKEIDNLDSNDMAYIPGTTVKDGVMISLCSVDWQVQSTVLVDDMLVPATYKAVAYYCGRAYYSGATEYISTAEYKGTVSCNDIEDITYTVTYVGTQIKESVKDSTDSADDIAREATEKTVMGAFALNSVKGMSEQKAESNRTWLFIAGGVLLIALFGGGAALVIRAANKKKRQRYENFRYEPEEYDDDEDED